MADCTYCHQSLPAGATRCPRCGTAAQMLTDEEEYERHGTVMEAIRVPGAEMFSDRADTVREPVAVPAGDAAEFDDAVAFRPVFRPPLALLTILDDGKRDKGESIRLRSERTVIGRTSGDVIVAHDNGISGTHAEIVRELSNGEFRWVLRDLGSRNGTFVRIAKARLGHNQQILIGAKRFRFNSATQGAEQAAEPSEAPDANATQPWKAVSPADLAKLIPSLVELGPDGEGERYLLERPDNVIGSKSAGGVNVVLKDDPFVSFRHCRVFKDERGRWTIENEDSLNGVWLRIESTPILGDGEFQLGEQRFSLRIL